MSIWLIALLFFAVAAGWSCCPVWGLAAELRMGGHAYDGRETRARRPRCQRESYYRLERMFLIATGIMYK